MLTQPYKLFLDDERQPYDYTWDIARSYNAFVAHIEGNGTPYAISFDHDLSFEHYPLDEQNTDETIHYDRYKEKTGYHAAQWLIENRRIDDVKVIYVHTMNIVGRHNLIRLFRAARHSPRVIVWQGKQAILLQNYSLYR